MFKRHLNVFFDFNRFVSVTSQENRTTESSASSPGWLCVLSSVFQLPTQACLCCQNSLFIQETLIFPSPTSHGQFLLFEALTSHFFRPSLFTRAELFHHTWLVHDPLCIPAFFSQSPLTASLQMMNFASSGGVVWIRCHSDLETDLMLLEPMVLQVTGLNITKRKNFPLSSPIDAGTLPANIDSPCSFTLSQDLKALLQNVEL